MKKTNNALAEKYISYRKEALEKQAAEFVDFIKPQLKEAAKKGLCAFTVSNNGEMKRQFKPFFFYQDARDILESKLGGVKIKHFHTKLLIGSVGSLQFSWFTGNENPEPGADSDDE